MAFKRVDKITERVQRRISDPAQKNITVDAVHDIMEQVQHTLAREVFAMKDIVEITLRAGEKVYDVSRPLHRIADFVKPVGWSKKPEIIGNMGQFTDLEGRCFSAPHPIYAAVWNKNLIFAPPPTTSGTKLIAYVYCLPTQPIQPGGDPELDIEYDKLLELGTLAEIDAAFRAEYEHEKEKMRHQAMTESPGIIQIEHPQDKTGF